MEYVKTVTCVRLHGICFNSIYSFILKKNYDKTRPSLLSQWQILGTGNLPQDSAQFVLILISLSRDGSTEHATKPSILCHRI